PMFLLLDNCERTPDWPLAARTVANRFPALTCIAAMAVEAGVRQPVPALLAGDMESFYLPPPTFAEYLAAGHAGQAPLIARDPAENLIAVTSVEALNAAFMAYLTGGAGTE